jgi:hypothetical protein
MANTSNSGSGLGMALWVHTHGGLVVLIIVWSIFWGGLALWHSGRRGHAWWFIIFLIVHTLGILEIIYLFGVLKLKFSQLFSK